MKLTSSRFHFPLRSACPERNDAGGTKGEDVQCEHESESGVLVQQGTMREGIKILRH